MNGSENTRWVAVSALGAAMFAIGFSVTGVACGTRDVSVAEAARAAESASALPPPASSLGSVTTVVNGAPPASSTAAPTTPDTKTGAGDQGLKVKRFVVTRKVENREPEAGDEFTLGSAPVYAFVELENTGTSPRTVRVLFENQDTKATVGHVKLSVPGSQARFRTWGNTRMIREPGHWVAVVSTTDGTELGRAPFEVKG